VSENRTDFGTLYGIGVGPGDPELIPLKAVRILQRVGVVFAAASKKNDYSLSGSVVRPHLKEETIVVRLDFPMSYDKQAVSKIWFRNAERVLETLRKGVDAAFITLGDPMTYSTFGYLMRTVKSIEPAAPIVVIPGITSFQAAAASVGHVLVEGEESLSIVSGALGARRLMEVLDHSDNVAILKVYRNYREIFDALVEKELISKSTLISRCGLAGEEIVQRLENHPDVAPHYLSLLLIRKRDSE
jgi:precorrin-2/cobalt-factor-2 C20-methyltransferase